MTNYCDSRFGPLRMSSDNCGLEFSDLHSQHLEMDTSVERKFLHLHNSISCLIRIHTYPRMKHVYISFVEFQHI